MAPEVAGPAASTCGDTGGAVVKSADAASGGGATVKSLRSSGVDDANPAGIDGGAPY
jgi:hypothetical protein